MNKDKNIYIYILTENDRHPDYVQKTTDTQTMYRKRQTPRLCIENDRDSDNVQKTTETQTMYRKRQRPRQCTENDRPATHHKAVQTGPPGTTPDLTTEMTVISGTRIKR